MEIDLKMHEESSSCIWLGGMHGRVSPKLGLFIPSQNTSAHHATMTICL